MEQYKLPTFYEGQKKLSAGGLTNMSKAIEDLQAQVRNLAKYQNTNIVLAKNKTGDKLPLFSVVQVKEMVFDPSTTKGSYGFKTGVIYEIEAPVVTDGNLTGDKDTSQNRHGVLIEYLVNNSFANIRMSGPVQAKINILDSKHEWCTPVDGQTAYFESCVHGENYILDREAGAKLRAGLAVALAVATFVVAVLQAAIEALHVLPDWEQIGAVAIWLQGAISFLGRFIEFGNKVSEG